MMLKGPFRNPFIVSSSLKATDMHQDKFHNAFRVSCAEITLRHHSFCNGKYSFGKNINPVQNIMLRTLRLKLTGFKGDGTTKIIIGHRHSKSADFQFLMDLCQQELKMQFVFKKIKVVRGGSNIIKAVLGRFKTEYELHVYPHRRYAQSY
jgi:hypothetical protein